MKDKVSNERTTLRIKHSKARASIDKQVSQGKILFDTQINTKDKLKEIQAAYSKWTKYNFHLLEKIFSDSKYAKDYSKGLGIYIIRKRTLSEEIEAFREDIFRKIAKLESIANSLELFDFKRTIPLLGVKGVSFGGAGIILTLFVILFGDNLVCRLIENSPKPIKDNEIPGIEDSKVDSIDLPYLENVTIIDGNLFVKYYYNHFNIGGVNAALIKLNARSENGEPIKISKVRDILGEFEYLEMDITENPYIELEYKGIFYSLNIIGNHYDFTLILKSRINPSLNLKQYIEI